MSSLWFSITQMDGEMYLMRRMGDNGRIDGGADQIRLRDFKPLHFPDEQQGQAYYGNRRRHYRSLQLRKQRTGPGIGRRYRTGLPDTDWRQSRDRQIDPVVENCGESCAAKQESAVCLGRRVFRPDKMRANRLSSNHDLLYLLPEINLQAVLNEIASESYQFIVIDSIQTLYSDETPSAPGSVTQVRTITFELMRIAKSKQIPIFIIGHITKDGSIAGPRVLEHMVDTVLYFEGDSNSELRLLRGFKNRFGSTNEVGIFEMNRDGLNDAKSMAGRFFNKEKLQSGSALTVIMEGSRPIIIEVQALVSEAYGNPKRSSTGFDNGRLIMLLALLEKKLDLPLGTYDVFINISGGIKINEPSADLAIIAAILSSYRDRELSTETLFIGEVSLTGEIREVSGLTQRLKEIQTQGFTKAVIPNKPIEESKIKCFIANEVSKVVEWM